MKKLILILAISGLLPIPAFAAATQEDVKYSSQVSSTVQAFSNEATNWGTVVGSAPTLTTGSKYQAYKSKAAKASDKFISVIRQLKGLKASPGFAKSGPKLVSAMTIYEKAITSLTAAMNKNDVKAIGKAGQLATKAGTAYLAWQKAYTADVAALNGK